MVLRRKKLIKRNEKRKEGRMEGAGTEEVGRQNDIARGDSEKKTFRGEDRTSCRRKKRL